MLEIADGGTVAGEASVGASRVEGGWMTVAPTRLGHRVFIGNSAVVPAGITLGDDWRVGVLTLAPTRAEQAIKCGATWLGSPSRLLPTTVQRRIHRGANL